MHCLNDSNHMKSINIDAQDITLVMWVIPTNTSLQTRKQCTQSIIIFTWIPNVSHNRINLNQHKRHYKISLKYLYINRGEAQFKSAEKSTNLFLFWSTMHCLLLSSIKYYDKITVYFNEYIYIKASYIEQSICSKTYLEAELSFLIETFVENGYKRSQLIKIIDQIKRKRFTGNRIQESIDTNETPDWLQVKTLKMEHNTLNRKVREALEIQYHRCGPKYGDINLDSFKYGTTKFWMPFFESLHKLKTSRSNSNVSNTEVSIKNTLHNNVSRRNTLQCNTNTGKTLSQL